MNISGRSGVLNRRGRKEGKWTRKEQEEKEEEEAEGEAEKEAEEEEIQEGEEIQGMKRRKKRRDSPQGFSAKKVEKNREERQGEEEGDCPRYDGLWSNSPRTVRS